MKKTTGCEACEVEVAKTEERAVYACRTGHEQGHSGSCHECKARVTVLVRWERA